MGIIGNVKEEIRLIRERDPAIHSSMEVFYIRVSGRCCTTVYFHKLYLSGHYFRRDGFHSARCAKTGIEIHPVRKSEKALSTTETALSLEKPQRSAIM